MIYLDNAATGGFKPNSVIESAVNAIKYLSANPGRSGHRLSQTGAEFVYSCRKKLSEFFNNQEIERVIFTKNCTEALNIAIHGILNEGGKVITTCTEHNSVLRPLYTLEKQGKISLDIVYPKDGKRVTANDIISSYTPNTSLVIVNSVSNVNGAVNEISKIGEFLRDKNTIFMVDGAQGAGHIKINMLKDGIDVLAVAGHKGLYSIAGSGALIFQKNVEIASTFQGGTGTETFNVTQPECYPEKLETGTLNLPSICALEEGVRYIEDSLEFISARLCEMSEFLINKLSLIKEVTLYSQPNPAGIVAFSVGNISSSEVSEMLSETYNIAVRGGYHCAPLMHKFLHTEDDGLVRVSISPNNTKRELYLLFDAVKNIIKTL